METDSYLGNKRLNIFTLHQKKPFHTGLFITFEGIDASGKSLQIKALYKKLCGLGYSVTLVRDPGGPLVSEKIRAILLDQKLHSMIPLTELFLYEAARSQLVSETINPSLKRGEIVLSDRFIDSTVAYQGYGRSLSNRIIQHANQWACGKTFPDRTYILDIPWKESMLRRNHLSKKADRMEKEQVDFYHKVQKGYYEIAQKDPQRVLLLDGTKNVKHLEQEIINDVLILIENMQIKDK
ncbi:dTMP kinase [bacterium]|nr:dTMP kinase [bacterium]RQV93300.1 MAG: dTMP kinase [bacterium]